MRCNQVSISIERFGKYVPPNYPEKVQRIQVYCDDYESIYAALSKAYALVINELAEHENVGIRTDVYTNEFSHLDHKKLCGVLPVEKRKYEEDVNHEYYNIALQLYKDRIWVYENLGSILEVLKECATSEEIVAKMKERFGLDDYQIRKLSQMRLDVLNKEEYLKAKQRADEITVLLNHHN